MIKFIAKRQFYYDKKFQEVTCYWDGKQLDWDRFIPVGNPLQYTQNIYEIKGSCIGRTLYGKFRKEYVIIDNEVVKIEK